MSTVDLSHVSEISTEPGELPEKMTAWVIREEREGEPIDAFQIEEIEVPEPGPFEAVVRVMAAGLNFNSVWAALGVPVSVFRYHPEDHHIGGSDASGIVWRVGPGVSDWKPGDEVVIHPAQLHPARSRYSHHDAPGMEEALSAGGRAWGFETTWGSFAQFAKVQSQQLLPKPPHLTWEESAVYGLTYFTAYRMLIEQCELQAGDNVLIWGAAGGLGAFATQLCKLSGANAVGVVSSPEKGELVEQLGAIAHINRKDYAFERTGDETPEQEKKRIKEARRFGKALREAFRGEDPDIVFEHVGKATFPTSVLVCKPFGRIVICGATSGYNLDFDVRYLWMRQKRIIGSHGAFPYQCYEANELVFQGRVIPVLWKVVPFREVAEAHQLMLENKHLGKIAVLVGAENEGLGKTAERSGAISAPLGT